MFSITDEIRKAALGPAPKARGNNPLSAWLPARHYEVTMFVCRTVKGDAPFTVMSTKVQRIFLLLVAETWKDVVGPEMISVATEEEFQ